MKKPLRGLTAAIALAAATTFVPSAASSESLPKNSYFRDVFKDTSPPCEHYNLSSIPHSSLSVVRLEGTVTQEYGNIAGVDEKNRGPVASAQRIPRGWNPYYL